MEKNKFELLEKMQELVSDEVILLELVKALRSNLAVELLEFIAKMHEIEEQINK